VKRFKCKGAKCEPIGRWADRMLFLLKFACYAVGMLVCSSRLYNIRNIVIRPFFRRNIQVLSTK
jgi:hypothetical protein